MTLDPSSRRAGTRASILVDEDDAARLGGRGVEEFLDVLLGLADPLAQHVGGRDAEERRVDLAGRRLGEHRFARARRAVQQHAAARLDAEPLSQLRVLHRVEHLQADVFLTSSSRRRRRT
jgi:hypothetical protein